MIRVTGYLDIPEDRFDDVKAALSKHVELTRAEPGNLTFNVSENADIPFRFDVSESFVNRDAFEHHQERTRASVWAKVTEGIARHFDIEETDE